MCLGWRKVWDAAPNSQADTYIHSACRILRLLSDWYALRALPPALQTASTKHTPHGLKPHLQVVECLAHVAVCSEDDCLKTLVVVRHPLLLTHLCAMIWSMSVRQCGCSISSPRGEHLCSRVVPQPSIKLHPSAAVAQGVAWWPYSSQASARGDKSTWSHNCGHAP